MTTRPNVLLIMNDDMGFSDLGCYGGEIETPNLDALASRGLKFTQFYNSPRCSPTRASLLTGLHPHQTGVGVLVEDLSPEGYAGTLNKSCVTVAEVLREKGYKTYMSGKWHLCGPEKGPEAWPCQRGFDQFYGIINGASDFFCPISLKRNDTDIEHEARDKDDYYFTDAISDAASDFVADHDFSNPFFMYVAYTAPHWPLHAKAQDIAKYKGRFATGWDQLRQSRLDRLKQMGMLDEDTALTERDPNVRPWSEISDKDWDASRMEVYAAQIDCMDQGIGRIIRSLEMQGQLDNTLILFLSDNGGCAEEIEADWNIFEGKGALARRQTKTGEPILAGNSRGVAPGAQNTYMSYGRSWANLSNTPFRLYKHYTHEGGIATPFLMSYPDGIEENDQLRSCPAQLVDVLPTVLDVTGASYPKSYQGHDILPLEGESLRPYFQADGPRDRHLFWEHEGNKAVRQGDFKLVSKYPAKWELYNLANDRSETHDVIAQCPDIASSLQKAYEDFAKRAGVVDREKILDLLEKFNANA